MREPAGVVVVAFLRRGRRRVVRIWWPMQFVVKMGSMPWLLSGAMGWMPRPGWRLVNAHLSWMPFSRARI